MLVRSFDRTATALPSTERATIGIAMGRRTRCHGIASVGELAPMLAIVDWVGVPWLPQGLALIGWVRLRRDLVRFRSDCDHRGHDVQICELRPSGPLDSARWPVGHPRIGSHYRDC